MIAEELLDDADVDADVESATRFAGWGLRLGLFMGANAAVICSGGAGTWCSLVPLLARLLKAKKTGFVPVLCVGFTADERVILDAMARQFTGDDSTDASAFGLAFATPFEILADVKPFARYLRND